MLGVRVVSSFVSFLSSTSTCKAIEGLRLSLAVGDEHKWSIDLLILPLALLGVIGFDLI